VLRGVLNLPAYTNASGEQLLGMAFGPTADRLVTWGGRRGRSRTVHIWDLRALQTSRVISGARGFVTRAALSRDGRLLIILRAGAMSVQHGRDVERPLPTSGPQAKITIWDPASGRYLRGLSSRPGEYSELSRDGALLATVGPADG